MNWFQKYLLALGDFTELPDDIFNQISTNLKKLEKKNTIDVSFVFIAHNEESRILPSVWSVSEIQTDLSVEVIVVNNASTDRTQDVIEKMGAKTIFQPKLGHGNARQAGMGMAKGKYHFSADSDTLYPPTYIDTMIKYLSKPGVSVVYAPYGFFTDGKKSQRSLDFYEYWRDKVVWLQSRKRPELVVGGAAMAFYTEHARQMGWRTDIRRGEDGSMLLALKKFGKPVLVLDTKARVRSSSRRLDADGSTTQMIWKRVKKYLQSVSGFFVKKEHYEDHPSNLR